MKKRILWLLNHTTLREFEVPMLIEMGYEVFTPKIYQYSFGDLSASVTWEYDSSLSIPQEDLAYLNECDMYAEWLPARAIEIMNRYFDMAIFGAFVPQIKMLVRTFKGLMVLQAFGLDATTDYTRLFGGQSVSLLEDIIRLGDRFWFGATYENLPEVECDYFKKQYVYLPIGLKHDRVDKIWTGGDKRILFIGPKINTNSYYRKVYQDFKRDFGMLPHVIGGAQMIPVPDDPAVMGFLPKEQYEYNMRHLAAMYYHSREPRHLHYHPLEAVANGMPLVFMAGGMLDRIGGSNLPGRCKTIPQARAMLRRLSNGDMRLAKRIVDKQGCLLDTFGRQFCEMHWRNAFMHFQELIERRASVQMATKAFEAKIAIVLPVAYTGGVLDFAIRLTLAIQKGVADQGDAVKIVLYYVDTPVYAKHDYFRRVRNAGIQTQRFRWSKKNKIWFEALAAIKGYDSRILPGESYVMEDGIQSLQNFDYCIFASDRLPLPFFCPTKYAIVVHDVIQRYIPGMFDLSYEALRQINNRKANNVIVTTPYMREEATTYCGINPQNVVEIPPVYEMIQPDKLIDLEIEEDYFVWPTNTSLHKNHRRALEALELYYARGGKLKCFVTGVNTERFAAQHKENSADDGWNGRVDHDLSMYEREIGKIIQTSENLRKNIVIKGEQDKEVYFQYLKKAKFVFHPGFADNGNGACVDALQLGVPTVTAQYPPMEYMNARLNASMTMFAPQDAEDIADQLLYMEQNAGKLAKQLPTFQELKKFMAEGQYPQIYARIRSMIRGY